MLGTLHCVFKWKDQAYGQKWGAKSKEVWNSRDPTVKWKYRGETPQNPEMLPSVGAEVLGPLFHFMFLFWLAPWSINMPTLRSLLTSPTICLDFVVFVRITQTNDSKAYLEAQLLIDLARSKVYFFKPQLSIWFMSACTTADIHQAFGSHADIMKAK